MPDGNTTPPSNGHPPKLGPFAWSILGQVIAGVISGLLVIAIVALVMN
jgi:hypothetical protein